MGKNIESIQEKLFLIILISAKLGYYNKGSISDKDGASLINLFFTSDSSLKKFILFMEKHKIELGDHSPSGSTPRQ